jgi:hypothetical protein
MVSLEDPAGHGYTSAVMLAGQLESPDGGLDPGATIRGPLYFSVPDGIADLQLTYWPSPLMKKAGIALS